MCGIAGVVGAFSKDRCLEIVRSMNDAMVHRGPDDEGFWAEDGFGFGMRRLSIIDLAGGHQPMWDRRNNFGVVFNGEIYNYKALREALGGDRVFRTHSDTEVALVGLAASGLSAVDSWNGMFAVAAWNSQERKLLLVRDRVGVKPLYYFWDGAVLLFASEIKAILASGLVDRTVNRQAVWDYLTYRYIPGPDSIWQGIRKLPPGHGLQVSPGAPPKEVRYWQTDVVADEDSVESRPDDVTQFAQLFLDAVQLRLIAADVPVGVLLSGGLDSSAVAAAAVELGHRNFHTFSIGFDDQRYSELPYARQMAAHVGAQHHEVVIDQKRFLQMLPEVVTAADEPLADLASVPLLEVCRLARTHVKVVLSGEGSDEVLGGYDLDHAQRNWDLVRALQRIPGAVLTPGSQMISKLIPSKAHVVRRIASEPVSKWNRTDLMHMTNLAGQREKTLLWPAGCGLDSGRILRGLYDEARSNDPLQQILSVYQKSWLVEDLLMKADKMSMATSLELRTPFLDYRLIEWANRQPNHTKVRRTNFLSYETKSVLRRFCATRVPSEILTRPKRGFPVPAYLWLQNELAPWSQDTLLGSESRISKGLSQPVVGSLLKDAASGHLTAAHQVWSLLILEHWLRAWDARI